MRWIKTESSTTGMATSISSDFFSFFCRCGFRPGFGFRKEEGGDPYLMLGEIISNSGPVSRLAHQEDLSTCVEAIDDRIGR